MKDESIKSRSGSVFSFIGGMLVGLVMGTVGAMFAPQVQPRGSSSRSSGSRKRAAAKPSRPVLTLAAPREELKMVLCVNLALGMGKGKTAAQCAHAAVGVIQKYRDSNEQLFKMWERHGQPKITLKIQDEQMMAELAQKALQNNVMCYIVQDAGRTQIAAGSRTVLAIGPAYKSDVDRITGHLPLL